MQNLFYQDENMQAKVFTLPQWLLIDGGLPTMQMLRVVRNF